MHPHCCTTETPIMSTFDTNSLSGKTNKIKTKTALESRDSKAVFTGAVSEVRFCFAKTNKSCQKPVSLPFAISPPAKSPLARGFARFLQLFPPHETKLHRQSGAFLFQGQEDSNPRPTVLETGTLPAELYPCVAPSWEPCTHYSTTYVLLQVFFSRFFC